MQTRCNFSLIIFLVTIGLFTNFESFRSTDRLLNSLSEDGYLMLTVARNFALGHGLSTADGEIMTNGIQPLVTFLWAGVYFLSNGEKIKSIVYITLIQAVIALVSTILIWLLVKATVQKYTSIVASIAALTWYVSPVYAGYTSSGLETGLYVLMVLSIALYFIKKLTWSKLDTILLGFLVGISFLVRNDAIFVGFALYASYLLFGQETIKQRIWKAHIMGIIAFSCSIPWLIYNYTYFGSIIPISSTAQSLVAEFGQNWQYVLFVLTKYSFTFIRFPNFLYDSPLFIAFCTLFISSLIIALISFYKQFSVTEQRLLIFATIYILGLSLFYGLFFGAPHFISRYLFPSTVFLVILWASTVINLYFWLNWKILRHAMVLSFCVIVLGFVIKNDILKKRENLHFQVVTWVKNNVQQQQWIGAVQSGTVGYFHDKTINLDGKVNPEALIARKRKQLPEYIIEKKLAYIADWADLMRWFEPNNPKITTAQQVALLKYYRVVVHDKQQNLAVLEWYRE